MEHATFRVARRQRRQVHLKNHMSEKSPFRRSALLWPVDARSGNCNPDYRLLPLTSYRQAIQPVIGANPLLWPWQLGGVGGRRARYTPRYCVLPRAPSQYLQYLAMRVKVAVFLLCSTTAGFQDDLGQRMARIRSEMAGLEASLLEVPPDIIAKYSDFLKLPETGAIKLLPRGMFSDVMRSKMEGGAYYSFVRRAHEYGQGNDIELDEQGLLRVGFAGADYGFFWTLGNGSIENLQTNAQPPAWLDDKAVAAWREAWSYRPPGDIESLRKERRRDQDHALPREGFVYLLRSVALRRSDILVAFRVERILREGGLVIIWRLLADWNPPVGTR